MTQAAPKSRGCATCRSRKIKCDLQKPSCNNCLRTGRTCQGYERHDVFVNRTAAGMQRRKRLEEVKDQRLEVIKNALVAGAFSQAVQSPIINQTDHTNWFYKHFVVPRTDPRLTTFLAPVMSILSPGPLLQSSLKALSIVKFGKVNNDPSATQQGQNLYGRSLSKLRMVLGDPTASKSDETLACAVTLGLYELLHVHPDHQSGGWFKHMMGLGKLIEHRGPKQSQTHVCRTIFEVCRGVLMTRCLVDRNSSVFGRKDWLDLPWEGVEKGRDERICDMAFRAANLISRSDKTLTLSDPRIVDLDDLVHDYTVLFEDVEDLHRDCSCYKVDQPMGPQGSPLGTQLNTWYLVQCSLTMAVQLCCCIMSDEPYSMLMSKSEDYPILHQPTTLYMRDETMRSGLAQSITRLAKVSLQNKPTPGPLLRIMWSMKMASSQLHVTPVEPYSTQCEEILRRVINEFPSSTARLQEQKAT